MSLQQHTNLPPSPLQFSIKLTLVFMTRDSGLCAGSQTHQASRVPRSKGKKVMGGLQIGQCADYLLLKPVAEHVAISIFQDKLLSIAKSPTFSLSCLLYHTIPSRKTCNLLL